jgi:hypothetical protein
MLAAQAVARAGDDGHAALEIEIALFAGIAPFAGDRRSARTCGKGHVPEEPDGAVL